VGDIDVFAVLHMMKKLGLGPDQMAALLASRSGLAGISGGSGDVRDLSQAASSGDPRAQLALDVFVFAIRRYLGAFLVSLGGVDVITFSGGIGENSAEIRSAVLKGMSAFGIVLDEMKNNSIAGEGTISAHHSPVKVMVIPANEEMIVAREAAAIVAQMRKQTRKTDAENSRVNQQTTAAVPVQG
jgi:acetate kinase